MGRSTSKNPHISSRISRHPLRYEHRDKCSTRVATFTSCLVYRLDLHERFLRIAVVGEVACDGVAHGGDVGIAHRNVAIVAIVDYLDNAAKIANISGYSLWFRVVGICNEKIQSREVLIGVHGGARAVFRKGVSVLSSARRSRSFTDSRRRGSGSSGNGNRSRGSA